MLGWLGQQYCCGGLQRDCFYEECPGRSAGLFYAVLHYLLVMIIVIAPDHLLTRKNLLRLSAFPGASLEQPWYRRPGWLLHNIYIVSRQSLYLLHPPSADKASSKKPGFEKLTACL